MKNRLIVKNKILIACASFVGILGAYIVWLQQTVELKPEVVEILKVVPAYDVDSKKSDLFYAYGFDALPDVDPAVFGKKSYDADWKYYLENPDTTKNSLDIAELNAQRINYATFWNEDEKNLLDEIKDHLNHVDDQDAQFWSENKVRIETLIHRKQFLFERYQQEINHKNYQVLIQSPQSNVPFRVYQDVHTLFLAHLYQQGNLKQVQDYVLKKLDRLNQNFSTVDRALLIVQLNQSIDVLNDLVQEQHQPIQLPVLNTIQLNFEKQAAYEMRFVYNIFKGVDRRFDYARNETHGLTKLWGKISVPFVFDFNQSMNQVYLNLEPYIKVSKLPYSQFAVQINHIELPKQHKWALRNNIGNILNQVGGTAWDKEVLRPRLLDNKIQVFNIVNSGKTIEEQVAAKSKEGYVFIQNMNQLCIKNPYKNVEKLNEKLQGDSCVYMSK